MSDSEKEKEVNKVQVDSPAAATTATTTESEENLDSNKISAAAAKVTSLFDDQDESDSDQDLSKNKTSKKNKSNRIITSDDEDSGKEEEEEEEENPKSDTEKTATTTTTTTTSTKESLLGEDSEGGNSEKEKETAENQKLKELFDDNDMNDSSEDEDKDQDITSSSEDDDLVSFKASLKKKNKNNSSSSSNDNRSPKQQDNLSGGDSDELVSEPKKKSKSKQKKRKKGEDDDDLDYDNGEQPVQKELSVYERAVQKGKKTMKRSKKNIDVDSTELDDEIQQLVLSMHSAADQDRKSFQNNKTAIAKLQLLPEVRSWLQKRDTLYLLVENKILDAMREWLTPSQDKSLPSLSIRDCFLELLEGWDIGVDYLRSSGLGRIIRLLSKHPKETDRNRKRASKLIIEWLKPVYKIKTKYSQMSRDEQMEIRTNERQMAQSGLKRQVSNGSEKNLSNLLNYQNGNDPSKEGFIRRARIPRQSDTDYYSTPLGVDQQSLQKIRKDPRKNRFINIKKKMK